MTLFGLDAGADAPAAVREGATVGVRLLVAYSGAGYHGFALQPGQATVGGALAAVLERHLRHTVDLTCAGRTDRGVHAWGQVVSFAARDDVDLRRLQRACNRALVPRIVVRAAAFSEPGFDARRSATSRRYRYSLLNCPVADPFAAATAWHVERPLDLAAMRLACDPLIGEHDFASFCRRPGDASLVRVVTDARWEDLGEGRLQFEIEASAFCHQMVRSIVGTLVEIGIGKRRAGEVSGIVRARDRAAAGGLAPPSGLCLREVRYGRLGPGRLWPGEWS